MSADATDSETKLKVERKDVAMYLSRLLIVVSPLALAPEDVTAGTIQSDRSDRSDKYMKSPWHTNRTVTYLCKYLR